MNTNAAPPPPGIPSSSLPPPPPGGSAAAPLAPPGPGLPPTGTGGLVVRVVLGLLLVVGAVVLVMWPRGRQLEASWRLTASLADAKGSFPELQGVSAGEAAALRIRIEPGPDAREDARLVCNAQSRPRVLVSGGRDLIFGRRVNVALDAEDEIPVVFTVAEGAAPGPREVTIEVTAELETPGEAVLRSAMLRRTITVKVIAARPKPAADRKKPKAD